jgi:hypothetical protein
MIARVILSGFGAAGSPGQDGLRRVIMEPIDGGRAGSRGMLMFRLLYFVVLVGGLAWILQTRPVWLEPDRLAEEPPRAAAGQDGPQREEEARAKEMFRRIKIVTVATVGVVAAGEIWCVVAGRWRRSYRT